MKGTIPRDFIEQLLAQTDIVQVIGQRVPLKKAGRNYVARCPFHDEKTPSFNVSPQKQFYHCFGCGASGDAIRFLQEYDGLSFVDAVEQLAQQAGLRVPYRQLSPQEQAQRQRQESLYDLLLRAARFYRHQLRDHPQAERAKAYLRQRGLTPEIAKQYYLGYAPPGWDSLSAEFAPLDQYEQKLLEAGLRIRREGHQGSYDRFRDRIIFPIRDLRGRVLGFGGRVLGDEKPKYLNSPETPVFHKSQVLYGFYELMQRREKADFLIVTEGYMDVIALAQHGVGNAVATLGTAVTEQHLQLLYRHVNRVVFSFDGDAAGRKAAWKAVELLLPQLSEQQSAQILFLPQGEDPDSLVRQQGREGFLRRVAAAPDLPTFVVSQIEAGLPVPVSEQEGRRQFLAEVTPWIRQARGWYQAALTEQAAARLGLKPWQLAKQLGIFVPLAGNGAGTRSSVSTPPVLGLPHRILRHLMRDPLLTGEFFRPEDLEALRGVDMAGMDLLVEAVAQLLHEPRAETVARLLEARGEGALLKALEEAPLAEDAGERRQALTALVEALLRQIALAQTDDLETLLALKKSR
ncbi:DNA primase [Sulfurivirga sp.]|uniref:DNA primase n=1 Tax=Sulfurivirga sp. TaxID=2614236 RepID=UPI0025FD6ACC|nr:DNA primase [Sulfurivirga sp.]